METIGKVKWKRAFWQINNIAFRGVNEDFISEKIKSEFFDVYFFASPKFGSGFLELGNPEKVSRKMLNFAGLVIFGKFLLVVIEAGGETALGILVHFVGTDLEFNNFLIFSDDGGVE